MGNPKKKEEGKPRDSETAVKKVMDFCEKEGIAWKVVIMQEGSLTDGGIILKPKVVIDFKENLENTN